MLFHKWLKNPEFACIFLHLLVVCMRRRLQQKRAATLSFSVRTGSQMSRLTVAHYKVCKNMFKNGTPFPSFSILLLKIDRRKVGVSFKIFTSLLGFARSPRHRCMALNPKQRPGNNQIFFPYNIRCPQKGNHACLARFLLLKIDRSFPVGIWPTPKVGNPVQKHPQKHTCQAQHNHFFLSVLALQYTLVCLVDLAWYPPVKWIQPKCRETMAKPFPRRIFLRNMKKQPCT